DAGIDDRKFATEWKQSIEPEPTERPVVYQVVSDSHGFVGAFYTEQGVRDHVLSQFSLTPFVVQQFAVFPGQHTKIWVVLYRDIDAVAFVSNDRDEAERRQDAFGRIGLTYPDNIDCWEHPVGIVTRPAFDRLRMMHDVHTMIAGSEDAEKTELDRLDRLLQPKGDGPIARLLREEERISILNCIVPLTSERALLDDVGAVL